MMNCGRVRWYLHNYSPKELAAPPSAAVVEHLAGCPGCDRMHGLFLSLSKDLVKGASPELLNTFPLKLDLKSPRKFTSGNSTSLLRKLDWWLMPEKTLKWSFTVILALVVGNITFNQDAEIPDKERGFPNSLIISHGNIVVTRDAEKGLHLSGGSNKTDSNPQTSDKDLDFKGTI